MEALEAAAREPPALVVSDLMMPRMDGFELLRRWKADPRLRGVPFLVYTATYTEPKDERLAIGLGADAFLVKPAEPAPFLAAVEEVLARCGQEASAAPGRPREEASVLLEQQAQVLASKLEAKVAQLAAERGRLGDAVAIHRGVIEASRDPIFSVDRSYRYTSFNRAHLDAMVAAYGARPELGHPLSEAQRVREDWERAQRNLDRALAGESFVEEAFSGEPGPRRSYFEVAHGPILDAGGAVTGVAVFARDVTKRRLAEEGLRASETLHRTLFETAPNGVALASLDATVLKANGRLGTLLGAPDPVALEGRRLVEFVIAEDRERAEDWLSSLPAERGATAARLRFRTGESEFDADVMTAATTNPEDGTAAIVVRSCRTSSCRSCRAWISTIG